MAIALALISAAVFGSGDFMGGLATRRSPVLTVLVGSQLLGLAGMTVVAAIVGGVTAPPDVLAGAVAGISGGIGVTLLYLGLATGAMALVAPITGVIAAVVPVGAGLVLGERPAPLQGAGIAIAIAAVVLLSGGARPAGGGAMRQPALLAVGSGAAFGVFYIALARSSAAAGLWPLVFARCASVTMFLLALAVRRERPRTDRRGAWLIAGTGVFDVAANALYLLAVHRGLLSIVAVLVSLYPGATVACSVLLLRERIRPWQALGIGVAAAAVVLITLG